MSAQNRIFIIKQLLESRNLKGSKLYRDTLNQLQNEKSKQKLLENEEKAKETMVKSRSKRKRLYSSISDQENSHHPTGEPMKKKKLDTKKDDMQLLFDSMHQHSINAHQVPRNNEPIDIRSIKDSTTKAAMVKQRQEKEAKANKKSGMLAVLDTLRNKKDTSVQQARDAWEAHKDNQNIREEVERGSQ
eukprot:CAMPEP_0117432338 /NCGR_PEP_ID=MMETSP0758-20121206/11834_1 /TAXON_ID=63605 /ORGANISM="Percolomonas cosmopolitus, Strain AE-1 (ATCC 50343)" /LENGTH=187 /DNA_ID=CAMNT_0005222171 /DNA_START=125 /DNA_END=688 /DNA_ORIENTATION=+